MSTGNDFPDEDLQQAEPVDNRAFLDLVSDSAGPLFSIARIVVATRGRSGEICSRLLLGELHTQAASAEELLDSYGARRNGSWRRLRASVAGLKLFSEVAYILFHIRLFMPRYHLLPVTPDFAEATQRATDFACRTITGYSARLLEYARDLGLVELKTARSAEDFVERLPVGELPQDCGTESVQSAEETVVYLATAFLNLAEDGHMLQARSDTRQLAANRIPDPINEEDIRRLEDAFHGLQARYDTYVADTNLESIDRDLPVLRGHITVIYHLLQTATALCHHYERHISLARRVPGLVVNAVVDRDELLEFLVDYSIRYADLYVRQTRELCQNMLRRYSVPGTVEVPVPRYRGFHVRPTTLIARIVRHYGAEVRMQIDGEEYDAAVPFDLFRANEKLNADKRRAIAADAIGILHVEPALLDRSREELVRAVARRLFEQRKLVLYDRTLSLEEVALRIDAPAEDCVVDALLKLFTLGKIDVELPAFATFLGDRRVIADIKLLAEQNYGEDDFGNNLALPGELSYLRR